MKDQFPTFRRLPGILKGIRVPIPALLPVRTSWGQRQSLLRLILVSIEEQLPLAPLIKTWAADESGLQKGRLYRLAELLDRGVPLADAVEEVQGVLGDEEILAVRFGAQSGTIAA